MADSHVLSGLISKRSELAGEVDHHKKEIARIGADLKVIDAAIKVFHPGYDLRKLRAKTHRIKNSFFKHGEANTLVLDVLREASDPINTLEIGSQVASRKGLDLETIDQKAYQACILTVLSRQRTRGITKEVSRDDNHTIEWRLA